MKRSNYPLLDSETRDDVYEWARGHLAFNTGNPELWSLAKNMIRNKSSNNHFAIRATIITKDRHILERINKKYAI